MLNKIMSKIGNWVKKKITTASIAFANVEKNAFSQKADGLESDVNIVKRHSEGQLADSLVNGVVTQEVIDLRWRTYKILKETQNVSSKIVGFDKSGYAIVETNKADIKKGLNKIKTDKVDNYELEMVIVNDPITIGVSDIMNNKYVKSEITPIIDEKEKTATLGTINGDEYYNSFKTEYPIKVDRMFYPKFMIENFTKKLNIRDIDGENKLLEFYVSKYPNTNDRKTTLFVNQIKKAMENPSSVNFLELVNVSFVTYKSLGVSDFLLFEYSDVSFDKIVEFDGNYVIKFKAKIIVNGEPMFDKYKVEELDKKYENKERK
jgi:hypothetical protein